MRSIICLLLFASLTAIVGCSKNDALVVLVQASFHEQFASACSESVQCLADLEKYEEECFDPALAHKAIGADESLKQQINTTHILKFQACLAEKSGTDHWSSQNMPAFILGQVK